MGRPKIDPDKKHTVRLEVLFTEAQAKWLHKARGTTPVSEFIRSIVLVRITQIFSPWIRRK